MRFMQNLEKHSTNLRIINHGFAEWARRQGFSRQYVGKLIKLGKIKLTDGKIDEYIANAELENQRHFDLPQQRKGGGAYFVQDDLHKLFVKTKLKNEIEKGKLLEARVKAETGELVPIEEVRNSFFAKGRIVRDGILNIPNRISSLLATINDASKIHEILTQELRNVLEELSRDVC